MPGIAGDGTPGHGYSVGFWHRTERSCWAANPALGTIREAFARLVDDAAGILDDRGRVNAREATNTPSGDTAVYGVS
jgi:hypothetical protein